MTAAELEERAGELTDLNNELRRACDRRFHDDDRFLAYWYSEAAAIGLSDGLPLAGRVLVLADDGYLVPATLTAEDLPAVAAALDDMEAMIRLGWTAFRRRTVQPFSDDRLMRAAVEAHDAYALVRVVGRLERGAPHRPRSLGLHGPVRRTRRRTSARRTRAGPSSDRPRPRRPGGSPEAEPPPAHCSGAR